MSPPKKSVNEGFINHYGLIRLRAKGSASLRTSFYSLDEIFYDKMLDIPVISATDVEPTRLANFTQQEAKLELRTININETFQISKIIIFTKPVASSFPETS